MGSSPTVGNILVSVRAFLLAAFTLGLSSRGGTAKPMEVAPERVPEAVLRAACSSDDFLPLVFSEAEYRSFSETERRTGSDGVLAALRRHIRGGADDEGSSLRVQRIDFDHDGVADYLLSFDFVRNPSRLILHRRGKKWEVVASFDAEDLEFLSAGKGHPDDLSATENNGGGSLRLSIYRFRHGRYVEVEHHADQVGGDR